MNSKTTVAFVVNQIQRAGPIIVIQNILCSLPRGLYNVHIIELRHSAPEAEELRTELIGRGCYLHSLNLSFAQLELRTSWSARHLEQLLTEIKADIVHSHTYQPDIVVTRLRNKFPILTTMHNLSDQDFVYGKGFLQGHYMHHRLLLSLAKHKDIVCITDFVRDYYRTRLPQSIHYHTIYNGIDTQTFSPVNDEQRRELRDLLSLPQKAFIMVMIGTLSQRKDPITVLKALHLLRSEGELPENFVLLFLGKGPLENQCHRLAAPFKGKVLFAGFVPQPSEYIRASNVAITGSWSEGFGLNVAEAIACGLPIATTNIGALIELTEPLPSLHPLRFTPGSVRECAEAIKRSYATQMTAEEHAHFIDTYSIQRMGESYHRLFQELKKRNV